MGQSFQNKDQVGMMSGRKTLEVNPNHPVIADLLSKVKADKDDKPALDTAQVLFQTALLESGYEIADPSALVNRVYRLMSKELGVDPMHPSRKWRYRKVKKRRQKRTIRTIVMTTAMTIRIARKMKRKRSFKQVSYLL